MSSQIATWRPPRPCVIGETSYGDGKRGVCYGIYVREWTHGAAVTIGGFPAGQESRAYAVVEFDGGHMSEGPAETVRFTDVAVVPDA